MLFTIVETFSPANGESWKSYCDWRGINFERLETIDGMLRPTLFLTPEGEDWDHIVHESFMLHYLTDLPYAKKIHSSIGEGVIVGVEFENHNPENPKFLGFDIIDGYHDVSLLTNFGNDIEIINKSLSMNGLVKSPEIISKVLEDLKTNWGEDPHVIGCQIVSLYDYNENE